MLGRNSREIIMGADVGVVRAYAVMRKPEGERWDVERMRNVRGSPQQPNPEKPSMNIPTRITLDPPEEDVPDKSVSLMQGNRTRRFRITSPMLREYGYTDRCEGCRWQKAGMTGHMGSPRPLSSED